MERRMIEAQLEAARKELEAAKQETIGALDRLAAFTGMSDVSFIDHIIEASDKVSDLMHMLRTCPQAA